MSFFLTSAQASIVYQKFENALKSTALSHRDNVFNHRTDPAYYFHVTILQYFLRIIQGDHALICLYVILHVFFRFAAISPSSSNPKEYG